MSKETQDLRDLFNEQSSYPQQFLDSLIETISLCNSLTHIVLRKGCEKTYSDKVYSQRLDREKVRKMRPCIYQNWAESDYMCGLGDNLNICLTRYGKLLVRRIVDRYKRTKDCGLSELSAWAVKECLEANKTEEEWIMGIFKEEREEE